MTKNQRIFQQEIARLERSISKLSKHSNFIQVQSLPEQPKRVTARHIKQLKELKGKHFFAEVDTETGEVLSEAKAEEIYKHHARKKTYAKSRYNPEYARKYRETHRDEIRERNRRYREQNRERIRETQRKYRERNRAKINAQARERRKRKKQQVQQEYYPTYSIYEAIYRVFQNALAELNKVREVDPIKVSMLQQGMSYMSSSRATIGIEAYDQHLKNNEEEIVRDIWGIVYASYQSQLEAYYTDLMERLNATGKAISINNLMDLSDLTESLM